ncbi:6,7-dimethyl-8-ribityllumazine synthase [soil metagenome]|nr:6,7-dimethyl-8-ribityllumazine synthase [Gemmatimonadota bacterium]
MIEYQGYFRGEGRRFGIVVGRFNEHVTRPLLAGARDCLLRHGVEDEAIQVAWVPGAWEIPGTLRRLAAAHRVDALLALGAVIRGGTPHFDYVAAQVAAGVAAVGAEMEIPVIFGVLTTDTVEQAVERAGTKAGNKGWDAALAALEMADLYTRLAQERTDARA